MFNRPKRDDSEDDILEMQKKFLQEKSKNSSFQPAAQAIRVNKGKKSLFAKSRNKTEDENQKPETNISEQESSILLGDIIENKFAVRRNPMDVVEHETTSLGFPKVERINFKKSSPGKSLFALSLEKKRKIEIPDQDISLDLSKEDSFGQTSHVINEAQMAKSIHEENVQALSQMTKEEILEERQKLLQSLDPKIIRFLEEKRKQPMATKKPEVEIIEESSIESMNVDDDKYEIKESPAVNEILLDKDSDNWIHFDIIEKDKLEWMKNVPDNIKKLKPGETFEARFDWKGVLLPYSEPNDIMNDNRDLYFHGEEPNRPGYTLQELFRLARSNVMQQRISAFGSISGIINIYNQGFYDEVLELPITKIFFLLRFGFDENSPAMLEVVSKGLALLFYNDSDEVLLDLVHETSEGYLQPSMETNIMSSDKETNDSIENSLSKMKLTSSPFTADIEESEQESKTSMNDFQLAETDLIECFIRTNIIQRISYILGTVRPENSAVQSCLKILIRIARTNKESALQIIDNYELINSLLEYFLPRMEETEKRNETDFYYVPQSLVLKLFRILISQHLSICIKLQSSSLIDKLKNYLFSRKDMNAKLIKVQIESFRILRTILLMSPNTSLFRELLPAFRYMLEWHYQHVDYKMGGSFLIRQHASALIAVIFIGPANDTKPFLGELLSMCCCKWFYEATNNKIEEFSQSMLLTSCLNCVTHLITPNDKCFKEFLEKYLKQFIGSRTFLDFQENLSQSSILLKNCDDRRNIHASLLNLGSILKSDGNPSLIISQTYPVYIIQGIFKIMERLLDLGDSLLFNCYLQNLSIDNLTSFISKLGSNVNKKLATNFLAKSEIRLTFKILSFKGITNLLTKDTVLQATFNLLSCMTSEHIKEIEYLFQSIIFTEENLNFKQKTLTSWRQVYLETFVYPHSIIISPTDLSLTMPCSQQSILPIDWPYTLLKSLLNRYLKEMLPSEKVDISEFSEKEIIVISLSFTALLERNGLEITSPTEKLMYLMIAFMGPDSQFLENDIKNLLREHISLFFAKCRDVTFQFGGTFEGKSKFENLYILFLDHFQAASYGDDLFSAMVLVPLAQKYDAKWRKMVWSEHASVLRFLNCDESQLLGCIDDYLYPVEDDLSLIKCYAQSLNTNLLRSNTISYKIASHHYKKFKAADTGIEQQKRKLF